MRKILITGGAGFVGRRFVKRFLDAGDEVHCVDPVAQYTGGIHPDQGWPLFDPRQYQNFHFYHEDCRDYFRRVRDTDFDLALHLAAMVGGRLMIENQPIAVGIDLSIDAEYFYWATQTKPKKTICFSSSAAYPIKFQRPEGYQLLSEEMIDFGDQLAMPDLSYGWAKLTCEYLARLAYEKYGLKSVCYRPFSGYGEDQDETYPFPSICKRVLSLTNSSDPLIVWGSGQQMRDFIYIEDCVDGVLQTMDAVDNGDAFNLSTGRFTSFIEFAQIAAKQAGFTPPVSGMSDKPEGVFARGGDTARQKAHGFTAKVSFETGIAKALKYLAQ